jgi:hypothetical protein
MNNFIKHKLPVFAMAGIMTAASLSLASCDDDDDSSSTPVVKYIRSTDPNVADSLMERVSMGQTIAIMGSGLGNTNEILFNDQKALVATTFVTDNCIIVSVPTTSWDVQNDSLTIVTRDGQKTQFHLPVNKILPKIKSVSLEYPNAGDVITITGAGFFKDGDKLSVELPGVGEVPFTFVSENELQVTVPDGVVKGAVVVNSLYGRGKSSFNLKEDEGILFNFDSGLEWQGWHAAKVVSFQDAIDGLCLQMGDGNSPLEDDTWDDGHFAFEYWAGSWDDPEQFNQSGQGRALYNVADFSDFKDKCIKFEMYIPSSNPWTNLSMQIIFAGTDRVSLSGNGGNSAGANNTFLQGETWARAHYNPWKDNGGSFDTKDKWITVSIPFTDFVYGAESNSPANSLSAETDFASLTMFVWSGEKSGTSCKPIIYIDNIRVAKY